MTDVFAKVNQEPSNKTTPSNSTLGADGALHFCSVAQHVLAYLVMTPRHSAII
jgi:hypothetical protein